LPLLRAALEIEAQLLDEEDAVRLEVSPLTSAIVVTRLTCAAPLHREEYRLGVAIDPNLPRIIRNGGNSRD
jgi:hypothetical protein